jgi:hypothetical protein
MVNTNIIGITGRKRHGKDTLGDYLVKHHGYTKIGFADALKEACRHIFGFNDDQLYGDLKEVDDEFWKTSPRKVLQYVGTDLFRDQIANIMPDVKSDIWIKVVENKILQNPDKRYVITDVRFENELEFLKKHNALTIKVQRDTLTNIDSHVSESYIDQLETKYKILNNGTLEELYQKLDNVINFTMHNKYTKASDFTNIKVIEQDTLYVFDIDETLMVYDGIDRCWWLNKFKEPEANEEQVISEWLQHIAINEPKHTHKASFDNLIEQINVNNNKIICLTARKGCLKDITEKHLQQIGVTGFPIHYSHGQPKGAILLEILKDYPDVKKVVFIDDSKINLISVNKVLMENRSDIKVYCYYYKYDKNSNNIDN